MHLHIAASGCEFRRLFVVMIGQEVVRLAQRPSQWVHLRLIAYIHLVSQLRRSGAVPSFSCVCFLGTYRENFTFSSGRSEDDYGSR